VKSFFNISNWPTAIGRCDLGGRALDILPHRNDTNTRKGLPRDGEVPAQ